MIYTKINNKWRGYYPKGGGEMHLHIKPISNLNAVTLIDVGVPRGITGWSYVAGAVNINVCHLSDLKLCIYTFCIINNLCYRKHLKWLMMQKLF